MGIHYFLLIIAVVLNTNCIQAMDNVTSDAFGSYNKFLPAAFGDFNSDKHTDIFAIKRDLSNSVCYVEVLLAHQNPPIFQPIGPNCTCPNGDVQSVVPGDFDGDGALDMLMLHRHDSDIYDVFVAWGDLNSFICPTESLLSTRGEPLQLDYNGDMIADLFGEDLNKTRSFWLFGSSRQKPLQIAMLHSSSPLPPLRKPSSHGFVDLNGDLAADLFVTAEGQFEIWMNTATGFILTEHIPVPDWAAVVGQTAFIDINLQGKLEPIMVMCKMKDCSDGQFYIWTVNNSTHKKEFVQVSIPLDNSGSLYSFPSSSHTSYPYTDTITLRVADHNMDGYPDILLTLLDNKDNPQVFLATNELCTESSCKHPRRMVPDWDFLKVCPNSVLGTFFDLFEDGRVDILLLHQQPAGSDQYAVTVVTDTKQYDTMFLKVLVPSGRCYTECKYHSVPYGTNMAGPAFLYSIITADGSLQASASTQLTQSAHMSLQTPYTLFGLGRNWNFVETLTVGFPVKDSSHARFGFYRNDTSSLLNFDSASSNAEENVPRNGVIGLGLAPVEFPSVRNFTQIIPNSQVIVIPYPLDQPTRWLNKLYITPSHALKLTAAALLAVCLLVSAVIAVLHYRERREDHKEKLQQAHTFHFDAM